MKKSRGNQDVSQAGSLRDISEREAGQFFVDSEVGVLLLEIYKVTNDESVRQLAEAILKLTGYVLPEAVSPTNM